MAQARLGPGGSGQEAKSLRELRDKGKALRASLPRGAHAEFSLPERDPVGIILEQDEARLADLVPVRIGRMLQSPFAYYRGTAAVMAHDLTATAVTGQRVVCSGDAHISNFGLFASPERRLLFDLNDFDEALTAPWEWDVKRLVASVVIGGRDVGLTDPECHDSAVSALAAYRAVMRRLYDATALDRYFFEVETDRLEELAAAGRRKVINRATQKARGRTSNQVLDKLVTVDDHGRQMIKDNPPIVRHVDDVEFGDLQGLVAQYFSTMRPDTAVLLSQFTFVDFVLRVVGVGSVGTRCYLLLLVGPAGEPLFLQAKEAPPSVLSTYGREPIVIANRRSRLSEGERVVTGQRILQAQSDPFLGWVEQFAYGGGAARDFYMRQFRDMKGSVELDTLNAAEFQDYARLCAVLLARAHSQSPGGAVIRGYLGGASDKFDLAVARWAMRYADQTQQDFDNLQAAVQRGKLPVEYGV
jgi:uncharacterized protein (DUF2252 family)